MKLIIVKACIILILLASATDINSQDDKAFRHLTALRGIWKMETSQGALFEEWIVLNKRIMSGRSYKINGSDTVLLETIQLVKSPAGIFYIPSVQDQNNQQPVSFKLVNNNRYFFSFENRQHNFPQRIIYRIVSADSVVARIEGSKNGKERSSNFYYKRVK